MEKHVNVWFNVAYKKGLVFLLTEIPKYIKNLSINQVKVFPEWTIPFEANASLYSNAFQFLFASLYSYTYFCFHPFCVRENGIKIKI